MTKKDSLFFVVFCLMLGTDAQTRADQLTDWVSQIQNVKSGGEGHANAMRAWQAVSRVNAGQLPAVLRLMQPDAPLANNWIRSAGEAIVDRALKSGHSLPMDALVSFIDNKRHAPRARELAFGWVTSVDPTAKAKMVPDMLDDSSLELRSMAVEYKLTEAAKLKDKNTDMAIRAYREALVAARSVDQIDMATKELRELGETVDLPNLFGFLATWHLIAPFDNTNKGGYDVAYPPEEKVDLAGLFAGKDGSIKWVEYATDDEYGIVDINKAIGKYMGAVAYALATFKSDRQTPVQLRLGCINANKVWLNGELTMENEVYHANTAIDQYISSGTLKKGDNHILVKICQNEQTDDWAQRWQFQLRVCDSLGTAILPVDKN